LIGQPELVFLADMATSLTEMAIKAQVEGEAYSAADDAKMMAVTAVADSVCIGLSHMSGVKNLAAAKDLEGAEEAEETTAKLAAAGSKEEKVKIVSDGAQKAAGDAPIKSGFADNVTKGNDLTYGAKASSSAAGSTETTLIEKAEADAKAAREAAQAKRVKEAAEAKEARAGAEEHLKETQEAGKLKSALAHETITTVGGGIVNGEDGGTILKNLGLAYLGELTGGLDERLGGLLGTESKLGKAVSTGSEFTRKAVVSAAGGNSGAGDMADIALGMVGDKAREGSVEHYNKGKSAMEKKLYTGGEVEAEMAEPKKKEEQEKAAEAREAAERGELYERSNEETGNGNE
jgi:hypothetical protein